MRGRLTLSLLVAAVLIVPAAATASKATSHLQTLTYYFKQTSASFTTPSGKPVTKQLARGDILFATENMYQGSKAAHASKSSATAFLYCVVKRVTKSSAKAKCDGVIAIGGSMLISQSTQNLASNSKTSVYPITAGTGKYLHATGRVTTTNVNKRGTEANGVIRIV